MSVSETIRLFHRGLLVGFTLGVIVYVTAMSRGRPTPLVGLVPLAPLILLLVSELYLFTRPYGLWRRTGRVLPQ